MQQQMMPIRHHLHMPSLPASIDPIQHQHRLRLIDAWQISTGSRLLEIGCGQGDMSYALALAVGEAGFIEATDPADPSYGAPLTLGEASADLAASTVGSRLNIRIPFSILDKPGLLDGQRFDGAVLAHCSWYFADAPTLLRTLGRLKDFSERLYFAEWMLVPNKSEQLAHFLSVVIQGQVEAYRSSSTSNVRSPFSPAMLKSLIAQAGWTIDREDIVESDELQDSKWEVDNCLREVPAILDRLVMPERLKDLVRSELDALADLAAKGCFESLPVMALTCEC